MAFVLVVDDDETILDLLREGFEVDVAANGEGHYEARMKGTWVVR